jgi:hypothetical protein
MNLAAAEVHDDDRRNLDVAAGRRHPRQDEIELRRVREAADELVDDVVGADRPRDRDHAEVRRGLRNEVARVELTQVLLPDAADERRNVVHVGLRGHRLHRRVGVARLELAGEVRGPDGFQIEDRADRLA